MVRDKSIPIQRKMKKSDGLSQALEVVQEEKLLTPKDRPEILEVLERVWQKLHEMRKDAVREETP